MKNKLTRVIFFLTCLFLSLKISAAVPGCIQAQFPNTKIIHNRIVLQAPEIVNDGSVVSIGIKSAELPQNMHITTLRFYSDYRKEAVAGYKLSEGITADSIKARIRLPKSGNIYAIATLSDGRIISGEHAVKVTAGGCGGGEAMAAHIATLKKVCPSN